MKWVNSAGGPLVCGERRVVIEWMGIKGLSVDFAPGAKNDYERACNTLEYLEVLKCGSGYILVLGDEPLQSSFFLTNRGQLAIARWVFAQSHDMEKFLHGSLDEAVEFARRVKFGAKQGTLTLFDSALPGANALETWPKEDLQPDSYLITTEKFQMDKRFSFLIHRFLKKA